MDCQRPFALPIDDTKRITRFSHDLDGRLKTAEVHKRHGSAHSPPVVGLCHIQIKRVT